MGFDVCSMPATGQLGLEAVSTYPGGGVSTWSPWLIQTVVSSPLAEAAEEPAADDGHDGAPVFAAVGLDHLAAHQVRDHLHAVAEAEHRHAEVQDFLRRDRRAGVVHRIRAAGEDDPPGPPLPDPLDGAGARVDLAVDVGLAHPARDELGELAAEVEDQDAVVVRRRGHRAAPQPWSDRVANGSASSAAKRASTSSRGRTTENRPPSTSTSAARPRVL